MTKPPPSNTPTRAFDRRWVPLFGATLITAMVGITVFDIVRARTRALDEAGQRLTAQARLVAEHTRRSFEAATVAPTEPRPAVNPERAGLERAAVEPLRDLDRSILLEPGATVALIGQDGTLVAHHPRIDNGAAQPSFANWVADAAPRIADDRYGVAVAVPAHAVNVVVSRDLRSVLAAWRSQAIDIALRTLVLATLAATLLVMLQRRIIRLDDAREKLATSEERYALAMTGLRGGHWVWDVQTDELFGSGRLNELFGVPPGYVPTNRTDYFTHVKPHPDDVGRLEEVGERYARGKALHQEFEYRVLLPDGSVRWIGTRSQAFTDAGGNVARVAGVSIDITPQKTTEEALRASEERFALAVAGSDDGIWLWDYAAGTAFESQRARELQGLGPGPEQQPLPDLEASLRVHPDDQARRLEGIRAHLAGETAAYETEYRVRVEDSPSIPQGDRAGAGSPSIPQGERESSAASWRWIRVRAVCTRDAAGKPRCMAGSVSDVDAREARKLEHRQAVWRLFVAAFCGMQVMMLAVPGALALAGLAWLGAGVLALLLVGGLMQTSWNLWK